MTTEMKEVVCTKCGATNIGPQTRCLRCQAVLPVEQVPQTRPSAAKAPKRAFAPQAQKRAPSTQALQKHAASRPARTTQRFCTQCGTPLKAGQQFCTNCGQRI